MARAIGRGRGRLAALSALAWLAAAPPLRAQIEDSSAVAADAAAAQGDGARAAWEVELAAAYANNSTLQLHLGEVAGVDLAYTAFGASRRLAGGGRLELRQTAALLPAMFISAITWESVAADCPSGRHCRLPSGFGTTGTTFGIGASPIGLETRWLASRSAQLYGTMRGGAAWFGRDVPIEGGGRVHYFGGIGGGARLAVGDALLLRVGYEALHLSNANTAPQNPGIDWHVWNVGLTVHGARVAAGALTDPATR